MARRELQEARWSAMCIQRCFRGFLARSKLLPHFRYLQTMLAQVDIGQVFALYLGWQNEQDGRLRTEARQQRWLDASAKMRKLVIDSERLNKVAVRAGSTALGAFASQRNNLVLTARNEVRCGYGRLQAPASSSLGLMSTSSTARAPRDSTNLSCWPSTSCSM